MPESKLNLYDSLWYRLDPDDPRWLEWERHAQEEARRESEAYWEKCQKSERRRPLVKVIVFVSGFYTVVCLVLPLLLKPLLHYRDTGKVDPLLGVSLLFQHWGMLLSGLVALAVWWWFLPGLQDPTSPFGYRERQREAIRQRRRERRTEQEEERRWKDPRQHRGK